MTPEVEVNVDADLVQALRRDEPDAADQLVERYGERVYRLTSLITGTSVDAEEAAQDALGTALQEIHSFHEESTFGAWMTRIAAGAAYEKLRARRPDADDIVLEEVMPPLDGDDHHFQPMDDWAPLIDGGGRPAALRRPLTDAIDALPAGYRAALLLHDVAGMSGVDIAETLGVSLASLKSRVHRSRLFVRQRLSEHFAATERGRAPR